MQKLKKIFLFFCILFFLPIYLYADNDVTLNKILKKIEKHHISNFFKASFIQKSVLQAIDIEDKAEGVVYFKYPNMMRWEYASPIQQAIITNGKKLWIYKKNENQVMVADADKYFSEGRGLSFLSNISCLKKEFKIFLEKEEKKEYILKLLSKDKNTQIVKILLFIDKDIYRINKLIIYNLSGDESTISFKDYQYNFKKENIKFNFKIPIDTEVIYLEES